MGKMESERVERKEERDKCLNLTRLPSKEHLRWQ